MTKGTGKKKIEIKKIENRQQRAVAFSKRRKGLFKIAQQLTSDSGAEIAILVQSQAGRFYVHGSPSFDSIIDRLLDGNQLSSESHINVDQQSSNTLTISAAKENKKTDCDELEPWRFCLNLNVESLNSKEEITLLLGKLEELQMKVGSVMMARESEFVESLLA